MAWFGNGPQLLNDPGKRALTNLCALAELDLAKLNDLVVAGKRPRVEKLIEDANRILKERFQRAWNQSTVYPRLSTPHEGTMRIFIATDNEEDYSNPEERSDGLRWFLALHAFLTARGAAQPIVLVDEAETHLHYDAQADLVDALMSQRLASKVIYTTHSVGCLPPDLGCGTRAVVPERGAERSRIASSYWSIDPGGEERMGYAPLLFAMGATMLAWTVPRYAVITEGPSDAILLPTLLREASGLQMLPYRIVPGLSETKDERMSMLARHAVSTVFLTDGDTGGLDLRGRLTKNGVPADRVFDLGEARKGAALEDLVDAKVFAEALSAEIEAWGLGPPIDTACIPAAQRWNTLCGKGTNLQSLNKARVAQRVVDLARPDDPMSPARRVIGARLTNRLLKLHDKLMKRLDPPTQP